MKALHVGSLETQVAKTIEKYFSVTNQRKTINENCHLIMIVKFFMHKTVAHTLMFHP